MVIVAKAKRVRVYRLTVLHWCFPLEPIHSLSLACSPPILNCRAVEARGVQHRLPPHRRRPNSLVHICRQSAPYYTTVESIDAASQHRGLSQVHTVVNGGMSIVSAVNI